MAEGEGLIGKIKDAVTGGGGGPDLDQVLAKAQEAGLDQDKVRQLLSNFTDADGNIDWQGAVAKAQEMGLDADKLKALVT
jgi:hypothetical protein